MIKRYDMEKIKSKICSIAINYGWNTRVEFEDDNVITFSFNRCIYTLDFCFTADMQKGDINTLIDSIKNYYQDFDVDYETYLWTDNYGHGKNGAPYQIKDIVSDMEKLEANIYELLKALEMEFL